MALHTERERGDTIPKGFVRVAHVREIPDRCSKKIILDNEEIALWHVGGKFYAVGNVCPHQHFSSLHQGELNGLFLTCPMHGWTYSLETGMATVGNGRVRTYRVEILGDQVLLEGPAGKATDDDA
jgi:nitrite reductase/ring-hydroxylating ferredoxin subunit